jgi:heterodisulfide reductase subunit A
MSTVESGVPGIFLAGCCQGPKDIPDTVAHAKAAASAAMIALVRTGVVHAAN